MSSGERTAQAQWKMTPQEDKAGLSDLPNEVILEQLLPILDAKDIASVSALNKRFHALAVRITSVSPDLIHSADRFGSVVE